MFNIHFRVINLNQIKVTVTYFQKYCSIGLYSPDKENKFSKGSSSLSKYKRLICMYHCSMKN